MARFLRRGEGKRPKFTSILLILIVVLITAVLISFMIGRYSITPHEFINLITAQFGGDHSGEATMAQTVLFKVRFSRVIGAVLIGGALALSGAAYQGLFKNPMVSPDILGASSGASFGAALAILLGQNALGTQIFAFAFGLAAVFLALGVSNAISKGESGTVIVLVLTGMVVSSLFSALVSIAKYVADPYNTLPAITFWLMGGLSYVTNRDILVMLVPFLAGAIPLILLRWRLNVLSFGDEEASSLGINPQRLRIIAIICSTLMTSAAVSIGGMIGWVGLVIPHLARMLVGANYKAVIPTALVMGSIFMLVVDDVSRCLFTQEIPLGILTAMIGAPFFLYLLSTGRRGWV